MNTEMKKDQPAEPENTPQKAASPILETTADAISLARDLMRTARHGAIATLEPETGYPQVTRTNCTLTVSGEPVFLMSDLAAHTKAIKEDPRTSLMLGEPGKGDPLAHPRITLYGTTKLIKPEGESKTKEANLRQRYINHHPKAELYNSLPDFFIYQMTVERALLNAGFGKAYQLTGDDLLLDAEKAEQVELIEQGVIDHMNEDHQDAIHHYAVTHCHKNPGNWLISGCDPEGIDMMAGDEAARLKFTKLCTNSTELREELVALAKKDRV